MEKDVNKIIAQHDRQNIAAIVRAFDDGKINAEVRDYLVILYDNGMDRFHEVFNVLGKCFGAPKAPVMEYDYATGRAKPERISISDINPLAAYMVHHRLDADPMRNQFFTTTYDNKINLSVSSIVSVIVASQKIIERALEKITGKYYTDYVNNVADAVYRVLESDGRDASGVAIADKIHDTFSKKFITNAPEIVLGIIGSGHKKIAVEMVRELDKITKPHLRLRDVWRVKCLFDLVPQARTFIERIREVAPDKIIDIKDSFYSMENPRNYRDAKIILNIGRDGKTVPMEIICQVRTLFEFNRGTHNEYENARKQKNESCQDIENRMTVHRDNGICEYNVLICHCVNDLFDRVGWNILYSEKTGEEHLFDGFPRLSSYQYYPQKVIDAIITKLDVAVENEVFKVTSAPLELSRAQELIIFRWMAKFIMVSVIPYKIEYQKIPEIDMPEKIFNFVMTELQRYYKK